MFRSLFTNRQQRLRVGWRILLQFLSFLWLLLFVQFISSIAERQYSLWIYAAAFLVYLLGTAGMLWFFAVQIDRRRPSDFGFRLDTSWWLDFAFGFLLGAFSLSLLFVVFKGMGWLQVTSIKQSLFTAPFVCVAAATFLKLSAIGFAEEFTFRAYQIKNLAEGLSGGSSSKKAVLAAWMLTSLLFSLAHLNNPAVTWMAALNVAAAGLLFGLGYILSGEAALPIGMHIAWGYFEEFIYGFANSGQQPQSWLLGSQMTGPQLWTGGGFGPEASLLVTFLIILDALLIAAWVKVRRRRCGIEGELALYKA